MSLHYCPTLESKNDPQSTNKTFMQLYETNKNRTKQDDGGNQKKVLRSLVFETHKVCVQNTQTLEKQSLIVSVSQCRTRSI